MANACVCLTQPYPEHLLNVEPGLVKLGDSLVEILGQLVSILNGHAPSLPKIGLHGMGAVAQQNDLTLGPLENRWPVKDVPPQHIRFWRGPAQQATLVLDSLGHLNCHHHNVALLFWTPGLARCIQRKNCIPFIEVLLEGFFRIFERTQPTPVVARLHREVRKLGSWGVCAKIGWRQAHELTQHDVCCWQCREGGQ